MISETSCELSIIVPSLGDVEKLTSLFLSLTQQKIKREKFEILVIFNGPRFSSIPQNLLSLRDSFLADLDIEYYSLHEKGANRGRNEGIRHAKSEVLLFLDDDCLLQQSFFLQQHIEFHKENAEVFSYGGGYVLNDSATFFEKIYNVLQMRWFISGRIGGEMSRQTQYLLGGNFSVKKSLMTAKEILFDESIVYGGTEHEFFKKANQIGLKMQSNDLDVIHVAGVHFIDLNRKILKQGRGKAIIDSKFSSVNSENSAEYRADSLIVRAFLIYFNYVFWFGYYAYSRQYFSFIKKLISDFLGKLNFFRFRLVEQNNKKIDGE